MSGVFLGLFATAMLLASALHVRAFVRRERHMRALHRAVDMAELRKVGKP